MEVKIEEKRQVKKGGGWDSNEAIGQLDKQSLFQASQNILEELCSRHRLLLMEDSWYGEGYVEMGGVERFYGGQAGRERGVRRRMGRRGGGGGADPCHSLLISWTKFCFQW